MAVPVTGQPAGPQQQLGGGGRTSHVQPPLSFMYKKHLHAPVTQKRWILRPRHSHVVLLALWEGRFFIVRGCRLHYRLFPPTGCPLCIVPLCCVVPHIDKCPARVAERPPAPQVENRCLVYSPCRGSPVTHWKCKAAEKLHKRKWVRFSEAKRSSCELGHQRILRFKGAGLWLWPWWWDLID